MASVYSSKISVGSDYARLRFDYTITQSESALSTTISYTLYAQTVSSVLSCKTAINLPEVSMGSSTDSFSSVSYTGANAGYKIGDGSFTVWHYASNGKPTSYPTITFEAGASSLTESGSSTSASPTGSITFTSTEIPDLNVTPTLTLSTYSTTAGSSITGTITKPANVNKVNVTSNGTTIYSGTDTSFTWTSFTTPGTYTITCQGINKNGTSNAGKSSKTLTLTTPSTWVPKVSMTLTDSIYTTYGVYVNSVSSIAIKATADMSADNGATVVSYSYEVRDTNASGALLASNSVTTSATTYTFAKFTPTKAKTFIRLFITDSRGTTKYTDKTITVVDYSKPSVSITANRCNSDGTLNSAGAYVKIAATWKITNVNSKNAPQGQIKVYGGTDGTTYSNILNYTESGLTGSYTFTTYPSLAIASRGYYYATIQDKLSSATAGNVVTVGATAIPFTLYHDSTGAIGAGINTTAKANRVDFGSNPIYINNVRLLDWVYEEGTSGNWTYKKWKSGKIEASAKIAETISEWSLHGSIYYNKQAIADISLPNIFSSITNVQATCSQERAEGAYGLYGASIKSVTTTSIGVFIWAGTNGYSFDGNLYLKVEGT